MILAKIDLVRMVVPLWRFLWSTYSLAQLLVCIIKHTLSVCSSEGCGGEIQLSADGTPMYISSPGYTSKIPYDNFKQCNWRITAPPDNQVELVFEDRFGVYCQQEQCSHWVEVKYKRDNMDNGTQGARFCCYTKPNATLRSEDQEMIVTFHSNMTASYIPWRLGFQARVSVGREILSFIWLQFNHCILSVFSTVRRDKSVDMSNLII